MATVNTRKTDPQIYLQWSVLMNSQLDVTWEATLCIYEALFEDCYLKQIIAASHKQIKMDFSVPKFIKAIGKNAIKKYKGVHSLSNAFQSVLSSLNLFFKENVCQCPSQIYEMY